MASEIKIFENGKELIIDKDNYQYVISLLQNKIDDLDKQCFFIASSLHDELVYWQCDTEIALLYAELLDKKINKYLLYIDENEKPSITSGFLKETKLKAYAEEELHEDLHEYDDCQEFVIKKLDQTAFQDLPTRLSDRFVKQTFSNKGFFSLERGIKYFLNEVKNFEADNEEIESETESEIEIDSE